MLDCFVKKKEGREVPITIITPTEFPDWLSTQNEFSKNWLKTQFKLEAYALSLIPDETGHIARVLCSVTDKKNVFSTGHLPFALPYGQYYFEKEELPYAIGWGLGAYQFSRYKKPLRAPAQLYLSSSTASQVAPIIESIYLVRDWVNTPTDDMGPSEFAVQAEALAKQYGATCTQIIGEELLKNNYATIYTVGRASDDPPRLLDVRWGDKTHPKVTLVGKGVCFDSGGLDIKSAQAMLLMKKDMAGGAHVFGLARMIMASKLPICLRVLVPLVENVIAGNAFRPGDIITSRKGLTIEVGNTDAEGRLILADALTEAVTEKPDLLIDITTLTGAARIALGTELPALFSNHDQLAQEIIKVSEKEQDPVWRLPLFPLYREYLNSTIADINNNSVESYAGAITAALFLKEFVPDDIPWLHFDMMAWNLRPRPGRPQGGEAYALRTLFQYLKNRYTVS